MTRTEGLKIARRILGARLYWFENPDAPRDAEEREDRKADRDAAVAEFKRIDEAKTARANALLAADEEYQTLKRQREDAKARRDHFLHVLGNRVEVGTVDTIGGGLRVRHQRATGDNWADLVRNLRETVKGPAI